MMSLCVFVGPERERKVPRSGFRRLGKHHITTDVFSLAVGQSVFHPFDAGWVHCRLCNVEVEINLHGQSACKEHWRSLGHSEAIIGLFWSIGVLAEIVLFTVVGRHEKQVGYLFLLLLAAAAAVARWPLLAIFDSQIAIFKPCTCS